MYERKNDSWLHYPLYLVPPEGEPLTTLDFVSLMGTLLELIRGLSATCHNATLSPDCATQDLTAALLVLEGYCETTMVLFNRWRAEGYEADTALHDDPPQGQVG